MKKYLLFVLLIPAGVFAQGVFPYVDFNNFFKVFDNGNFTQLEHNIVSDIFYGDELVAYNNSQRDFKVYHKGRAQLLTNQNVTYKASDHLLAWNIGPIINYFEDGKPHVITSFGGSYEVTDSLIVYQDTRYNTVNAIYKGKTIQLYQTTGDLHMPDAIGDNIIAFRDNGNLVKVFWRGQIYELGVYSGSTQKIEFVAGTDILAFNDPSTRTFAVFENGEFLDVEDIFVNKVKACRGFVVYEDVQGNLRYYGKGDRKELASFYQFWDAKDDVVFWGEANSAFTLVNGERRQVVNYVPKDWALKNDVIAFRSNLGGVSGFVQGKLKDITNLTNTEYFINGHLIGITQPNRSVTVLWNGNVYRD
jgi:hypothetical protein